MQRHPCSASLCPSLPAFCCSVSAVKSPSPMTLQPFERPCCSREYLVKEKTVRKPWKHMSVLAQCHQRENWRQQESFLNLRHSEQSFQKASDMELGEIQPHPQVRWISMNLCVLEIPVPTRVCWSKSAHIYSGPDKAIITWGKSAD